VRLGAATLLVLLATAAPAGAFPGSGAVRSALNRGTLPGMSAASSNDATHTCQAGDRRRDTAKRSKIIGDSRKTAVVACEQPPRSSLLTPDQVAKATAAALNVLG